MQCSISTLGLWPKKSHFEQRHRGVCYHPVLPPPYGGVLNTGALEVVGTRLLESVDTVAPVVLQVAEAGVHRVGGAHSAQTTQGEVVVED